MLSQKLLLSLALASSALAACNPLTSSSCSPDPALGSDINESFTSKPDKFSVMAYPDGVNYTPKGLELTLAKRFDNPSLKSDFYIMFGRVEVHLKAAPGVGVVSSFYLQSDDLDEIDIEMLGGDTTQFQSNWFTKGNTATYDRGEYHNVASPQADFHNYTIDWTKDHVEWWYDGQLLRTLTPNNPQGFPQTPMQLFAGIWAGGDPNNAPGTIEWAGGLTQYDQAPFTMAINKLLVSDYSSGTSYSYSDQSGSWSSISAKDGKVNGRIGSANASPQEDSAQSQSKSSSSASSTSSTSSSSSSSVSSSTSTTSDSSSSVSSSTTTTARSTTGTSVTSSSSTSVPSSSTVSTTSSSKASGIETVTTASSSSAAAGVEASSSTSAAGVASKNTATTESASTTAPSGPPAARVSTAPGSSAAGSENPSSVFIPTGFSTTTTAASQSATSETHISVAASSNMAGTTKWNSLMAALCLVGYSLF
ncbi:glycoside hydrolase family 16 protein [Suhomyces tanzawaensis NRRL Y-17324]|uniref:Crh-like protein n=1 Tax=Suhomyces tanzawaensis NRRL Y-17324 TaxID=984487 RepID=A0A1E4SE09_9ASCO|nr:glycoside hydrolase family 16 protein [Suhomyces tanzawaensis NRRL Y-17324]ODV77759.1 glycoside hydrolase family 16 protein [Suhomyces tanzawaensis NRRL Y-17324]